MEHATTSGLPTPNVPTAMFCFSTVGSLGPTWLFSVRKKCPRMLFFVFKSGKTSVNITFLACNSNSLSISNTFHEYDHNLMSLNSNKIFSVFPYSLLIQSLLFHFFSLLSLNGTYFSERLPEHINLNISERFLENCKEILISLTS